LLRFIQGYQEANEETPSFDKMRAGIGATSKSIVHHLLNALEERGYIWRTEKWKWGGRSGRAIEILYPVPIPRAPDGAPLYFVEIGG
jgi:SOS-response transcriptional repressor LexA